MSSNFSLDQKVDVETEVLHLTYPTSFVLFVTMICILLHISLIYS